MISAAWTWAANNHSLRKNPIHGEEEAKLIISDKFEAADSTENVTSLEGQIEIEEP